MLNGAKEAVRVEAGGEILFSYGYEDGMLQKGGTVIYQTSDLSNVRI